MTDCCVQASGYLRVIVFRGGEEQWLEHYNACIVVRPDKRRRRDGSWADTKLLRPHRSVNVVASLFGRWYYLGMYQCSTVATLGSEVWEDLPEKVCVQLRMLGMITDGVQSQRGVLRFMAHNDDRHEARDGILQGNVGLHRIKLLRVGFDGAVQDALVAAGKRQVGAADSDGSYGSDGEAYR